MVAKIKDNPRDGRVVPGVDGEPAEHKVGSAAAPYVFKEEEIAEELNLWWEAGAGSNFLIGDGAGWASWTEKKVQVLMKSLPNHMIAMKPRDGERLSECDRVLLHTMQHRRVDWVLPGLAGYPAGVQDINGQKVIVKYAPKIVEPVQGDWSTIKALIETRLDLSRNGGGGINQTPWFYSWLKIAFRSLVEGGPGNFQNGHAVIFAGPNGCGKGRLQHQLITGLLGGRSANAGPFLFTSGDMFNGDLFEGEHLLVEEAPVQSQKMADRVLLSEKIKQIVANDIQRMRRMRMEPLTLAPYWRLTISINDDPDKMRSLPCVTPDYKDKVLMFLVSKNEPLPMPTETLDERKAFREAIESQLPAFAYWLMHEFEIPKELLKYEDDRDATRFGFREFQHPQLVADLFDDTPHAELMMLIDAAEFWDPDISVILRPTEGKKLWQLPSWTDKRAVKAAGGLWWGGALDLEQLLKGEGGWACSVAPQARKLLQHNSLSRLLSRLAKDESERSEGMQRVTKGDTREAKGWKICRPIH